MKSAGEELNNLYKELEQLIGKMHNKLKAAKNHEADIQILKQFESLLVELNNENDHLKKFENELEQGLKIIMGDSSVVVTIHPETVNQYIDFLSELISDIEKGNNLINLLLNENNAISKYISGSIKESIIKIRYYDYFDKTCDTIIEELNALNLRLNYGTSDISGIDREDNLKHLKERYTMASEHVIHDHLSKISAGNSSAAQSAKEAVKHLSDKEKAVEDDNLELF